MRETILSEIRRLAAVNEGQPPGRQVFERETGIRAREWLGVYWARWGDALAEAGLSANQKQGRLDQDFLLEKLAQAVRHYGKVPTATWPQCCPPRRHPRRLSDLRRGYHIGKIERGGGGLPFSDGKAKTVANFAL